MRRLAPLAGALTLGVLLTLAFGSSAQGQSSPGPVAPGEDPNEAERAAREAEMFGESEAPATAAPRSSAPPGWAPSSTEAREDALFGEGATSESAAPPAPEPPVVMDPLQIGGQFYLRFAHTLRQGDRWDNNPLSMPNLVDLYFDARPTERMRAYLRGRLTYDPTIDANAAANPLFSTGPNPNVLLDQLWLKVDIARTAFLTVGAQRIRWGPAFLWNPVDIVHPVRRNPLVFFDERVGTTLVKLHLPVESLGWNFYVVAMMDRANTLENVGGAFRGEFVVGTVELGLSASARTATRPRFGLDFSAGVWELDIYGEAALHWGTYAKVYGGNFDVATGELPQELDYAERLYVEATGGLSWTTNFNDRDQLILGGEFNYNGVGYDDPDIYPFLFAQGGFVPFYTGRYYAAVFATVVGPGSLDDASFTLFNLGNLSDLSFVSRVNATFRVLTWLQLEAFVGVHYGTRNGEFRLGVSIPDVIELSPQLIDLGLNFRLQI